MSVLIWIETVWHYGIVLEKMFWKKVNLKKVNRRQHKLKKITQHAKIYIMEICKQVLWQPMKLPNVVFHQDLHCLVRWKYSKCKILTCDPWYIQQVIQNQIEEPLVCKGYNGLFCYREQNYFNIALVLQDEWLTILTCPANTCSCPLKAYAVKNIRE